MVQKNTETLTGRYIAGKIYVIVEECIGILRAIVVVFKVM